MPRVRAAYDRVAPAFADKWAKPGSPTVLELGDRFLSMLAPGARVLDLGCGPAHEGAWLASQGARVFGGDLSAGMLDEARRRFTLPLVQLDMRRLPFAADALAGVWCIASLLHLPKAEAPGVLNEIRRVLVPGGALALAVQEGEGEEWNGGYVDGVERFFARYGLEEMAEVLNECGFEVVVQERAEGPARSWLRYVAKRPAS